jgi:hypothetical protein
MFRREGRVEPGKSGRLGPYLPAALSGSVISDWVQTP